MKRQKDGSKIAQIIVENCNINYVENYNIVYKYNIYQYTYYTSTLHIHTNITHTYL